jgi:hypothetical protein
MDYPLTIFIQILATILGYCLLLVFGRFVLGYKLRKVWMVLSFLTFVPSLVFYHMKWMGPSEAGLLFISIAPFVLLKLIFPDAKLTQLFFVDCYVVCSMVLVLSVVWTTIGLYHNMIERIVVTIVALIWLGLFFSPLRHKLRDVVTATPNSVLIVSYIICSMMIWLSCIQFYETPISELGTLIAAATPNSPEADVLHIAEAIWIIFQQVVYMLVELSFFVGLTFYLYYAASYSRVKVLNASYEQQIQIQADHYKKLADANTEVRRFRHDFKNIRFSIEKLLSEGKNEEALNLMQAFGDTLDAPKRQMLLFDTGNGIADALLTDKLRRAAADNTVVNFSGAIPQNALLPTDLCVLLGNTLDNAIEACQKLPQDSVKAITVKCNCSSGFLFLSICNPIANEVTIMDNRIATTKKDTLLHGFGIQSMHNVAKKYDGSVELNADNGFFTVNIDLCVRTQGAGVSG